METEKTVLLEELTHRDIGKAIFFLAEIGPIKAEFQGTLAGIDRQRIMLKNAQFRKSSGGDWAPTNDKNPEIPVDDQTLITVFKED